MTPPLIIGQAPARGSKVRDRHGILVPFQGPSGGRLRLLAGVENLEDHFLMWNLLDAPAIKTIGKGDDFDMGFARGRAARDLTRIKQMQPPMILLMGRKVEKAFGFKPKPFLTVRKWQGLKWVVFPHPSGVSHWWNDRDNRIRAERFLKELIHGQNG